MSTHDLEIKILFGHFMYTKIFKFLVKGKYMIFWKSLVLQ